MKSKIKWFYPPLIVFLLASGLWILIVSLQLGISKSAEDQPPFGVWLMVFIFSSITLGTAIASLYLLKRIQLTDKTVVISFIIRNKRFEYPYEEIIGYEEHLTLGRYKNLMSFHFKTTDGKTYMFTDSGVGNYAQISNMLAERTKPMNISKVHNWKPLLSIMSITFLLVFAVMYVTLKSNILP